MAWQTNVNVSVNDATNDPNGAMIWRLKELLVNNCGWTVRGSGEGQLVGGSFENVEDATGGPYDLLTVDPATDDFDNTESANSFSNRQAWMRLRAPTGTLEIVMKRSDNSFNDSSFAIGVAAEGFTDTGVANATTPPTGTTEKWLNGSTSSTSYAAISNTSLDNRRIHIVASDTEIDGAWPFYCCHLTVGTTTIRGGWWLAGMSQPSSGDSHPWVTQVASGDVAFLSGQALGSQTVSNAPYAWWDYGGGGQTWGQMPACRYANVTVATIIPGTLTSQPDGNVRHLPIIHANSSIGAWKGINNLAQWKSTTRAYPDTFGLGGANPRVVIGDLILPWEGGTVPL